MKRSPEAFRSRGLFDKGIGHLTVARFKGDGRVECGIFLLDVYCLGVKNAFFRRFESIREYREDGVDLVFANDDPMPMTAASGRHLAESAVAYAARSGLYPHPDYRKAARVFGGIPAADADERFEFGHHGKPFYIRGPYESEATARRILNTLERKLGMDGFEYLIALDFDEEEEEEDEWGDERYDPALERVSTE